MGRRHVYKLVRETKTKAINISMTVLLAASTISGSLPLLLAGQASAASATIVTSGNLNGWNSQEGSPAIVSGPTGADGNGSLKLTTDNEPKQNFYHAASTPLSSVTGLGYSVDVSAGVPASYQLQVLGVHRTDSSSTFTSLVWEPVYNGQSNGPNSGFVTENNLENGIWWSSHPIDGDPDGNNGFVSLSQIQAANPGATVVAFGVNVGSGTANATSYVDDVTFGSDKYNFETVVIPSCDTTNASFDTFSDGSVNGQNGWKSTGNFDQSIVDNTYGYDSFGCKSLRISNARTSGSFGDQTFSSAAGLAGESSTGAGKDHFEASFDIASTLATQQSGLSLSVSPDRGDGSRMSYLRFEDQPGGIHVFFDDVTSTSNPALFNESDIATLSRTPHTVKFDIDFKDGPSNDVVRIYIDGNLVKTGTTWENYYRYDSEASAEQSPRAVGSLLFRLAGAAATNTDGNGYLIDNVSVTTRKDDTSAPSVAFTSPADGKVFSGTPNFELTASDDTAIRNVTSTLYDSGNNVVGWKVLAANLNAPTFSTDGPVTYDTSGTPLPDGDYKMVAAVQDMAGNYGPQAVLHVHIDHTAPTVTVTPVSGSLLHGTVTFNITVDDAHVKSTDTVWVYLFNNAPPQKSKGANVTLTNGHGTFTVDTSQLADGLSTLDVQRLSDAAGNYSGAGDNYFRNFFIDNTGPVVTINTPGSDIFTKGSGIPVNVSTADNHALNTLSVYLTDNAGNYIKTCTSASNLDAYPASVATYTADCSLDLSGLADGTYKLVAKSQDRAGNFSNTATRLITVDHSKPIVTFVSPTDFTNPFQTGPDVTVTASDTGSGLDVFVIHVYKASDNSAAKFCTATTSELAAGSMHCDLSGLADGTYYIKAGATDKAGNNQTISSGDFVIDSMSPTATIDAYNGTDTTPTLSGTVDDPTADLTIAIDGGSPASATNNGDGTWMYTLPTALGVGSHTVTLTASDTAGNTFQTTANATVEAPQASPQGLTNSNNRGNSNNAPGHQSTVTVTPNNDGQVLGANTDSTDGEGAVKGASTTNSDLPTVNVANTGNSQTKSANAFLGLGWWWLAILAVVAVVSWLLLGRKSLNNN